MLTAVLQSLLAPRYIRRYVGRHRERLATTGFSVGVDAEVVIAPAPRPAGSDGAGSQPTHA
jgi:hypothetical protein